MHIGDTYQQILKENFDATLKQILKFLIINKINFETNWNQIVVDKTNIGAVGPKAFHPSFDDD